MYINEAAQQFIDSHKPEKIDVDRIKPKPYESGGVT